MRIATLGRLDPNAPRPETWPDDKAHILEYLNNGRDVIAARMMLEDEIDPDHPARVPLMYFTDGTWVWSSQVIYYAENHDIPVDPELVEFARAHNFTVGPVDEAAVDEALDALDDADDDE